jgi:hypothetical protein
MTVTAKLKLEQDRLSWGQSTDGTATIINDGETALEFLNYSNERAMPSFILTNTQTGEITEYARLNIPGSTPFIRTIERGETWEAEFRLSYRFQFPSAGLFEVKTRFDWEGGSIESNAVEIDVVRTSPLHRAIETTGGGPVGDLFCAWVNEEDHGGGLWLSLISAQDEVRFQGSQRICDIALNARPLLSIPPNTSPTSQYIGWIERQSLNFCIHTHGQIRKREILLGENGYSIVPPLLEDPLVLPIEYQNAEALLQRQTENGWELRVVSLAENSQKYEPLVMDGRLPRQGYTAYRSDNKRRTVFWQQDFADKGPAVVLSIAMWGKSESLTPPQVQAEWAGEFVAADQSLTDDDSIVGAVLLHNIVGGKHNYELRSWRLDPNDNFTESAVAPFIWNSSSIIEKAVVRIRSDENIFAIFQFVGENLWRKAYGSNETMLMPQSIRKIGGEIDVFFVAQSVPAILYTDPERGLNFAFEGSPPKRFSPTGS